MFPPVSHFCPGAQLGLLIGRLPLGGAHTDHPDQQHQQDHKDHRPRDT